MTGKEANPPRYRSLQQEITDLPNLITLARILLIPLILVWIDNYSRQLSVISATIFLIAALSDVVDGYLARRMGLVTVVGKFLDPLADKLIVLSTLVMLVEKARIPAWLVIILMARELAVTGLRAIASQQGFVISAGAGGKAKSAFQMVGIVFLLVHFPYRMMLTDYVFDFHKIGTYLLYLSLIMSVASAFEYFWFFAEAARKQAETLEAEGITRSGVRQRLEAEKEGRRERKTRTRRQKAALRRENANARLARRRRGRRERTIRPDRDEP